MVERQFYSCQLFDLEDKIHLRDRECLRTSNDNMQIILHKELKQSLIVLRTFVEFWFHARCVTQKVNIFRKDCLLMFLKGFGIELHEAPLVHVG